MNGDEPSTQIEVKYQGKGLKACGLTCVAMFAPSDCGKDSETKALRSFKKRSENQDLKNLWPAVNTAARLLPEWDKSKRSFQLSASEMQTVLNWYVPSELCYFEGMADYNDCAVVPIDWDKSDYHWVVLAKEAGIWWLLDPLEGKKHQIEGGKPLLVKADSPVPIRFKKNGTREKYSPLLRWCGQSHSFIKVSPTLPVQIHGG